MKITKLGKLILSKRKAGVSLINLVITIIVVLILLSIVVFSGLTTPENANLAKFSTEVSNVGLAVTDEYSKRYESYVMQNKVTNNSKLYYEVATGKEIERDEDIIVAGNYTKVNELNLRLQDSLKGTEFYQIVPGSNIKGWYEDKNYYTPDEKHYITNEGEVFILPGYRAEVDGEIRWYINETLYYLGDKIVLDESNETENKRISFDSNGGTGEMITITKAVNSRYILPSNGFSAPSGKTFDGWLVDGVKLAVGDEITITDNIVIKANWKTIQYEISFVGNGGTGSMEKVVMDVGSTYILPENRFTPPQNKVFDGWLIGANKKNPGESVNINTNVTVTASWKTIQYEVSFASNGGTGSMETIRVDAGSLYILPENSFTAPQYKVFEYWSIGGTKKNPGESININTNITLTASWKTIEYEVRFESNGGTGSMQTVKVDAGSTYILPECGFTPQEYKLFDGWSIGGMKKDVGTKVNITGNLTLKANWKTIQYEISFVGNGGTGSMSSVMKDGGTTYILPSNGFAAPMYKEFIGWEVNGETKLIGDQITITGNTTLTAQWKLLKYMVNFAANGGTGTMESIEVDAETVYPLPQNQFTAPKCKAFNGWLIDTLLMNPNETVTIRNNLMVTAQWKDAHTSEVKNQKDATCTEKGYTGDTICSVCSAILSTGMDIQALGHVDENSDGVCDRTGCGENLNTITVAIFANSREGKITASPSATWKEIVGDGYSSYVVNQIGTVYEYTLNIEGENIITDFVAEPATSDCVKVNVNDRFDSYETYYLYSTDGNSALYGKKKIITFTISDNTYQAESGMTWLQWLDSDYNTPEYVRKIKDVNSISSSDHVYTTESWCAMVGYNNDAVSLNDKIIAGAEYIIDYWEYTNIEFTINGNTFEAEEGMTWGEWLTSCYNTTEETEPIIQTSDGNDVNYSDIIVANTNYKFSVYELGGTWIFNETLNVTASIPTQTINFITNGENGTSITVNYFRNELPSGKVIEEIDLAYDLGHVNIIGEKTLSCVYDNTNPSPESDTYWVSETDKTIAFPQKQNVSKDFYEWFTANATQIITFTIDGIEYQAEKGMTWAEWCDSKYNTDEYFVGTGRMITKNDVIFVTDGVAEVMDSSTIRNNKEYFYGS